MKVLVIHGPNLNLLGIREPHIYGTRTLENVNEFISSYFKKVTLDFFQSNHEGEIVDKIQQAAGIYDGIVLNAAAYTHYSYAIRDVIEAVSPPVIEVHISNVYAREKFRHKSVISDVCNGTIVGLGVYGYVIAVQSLAHHHKRN